MPIRRIEAAYADLSKIDHVSITEKRAIVG
jgi:hypothetical protein